MMLSATKKKYLLAIYELCKDNGEVRSKDIAENLDVKRSTVSKILKELSENGLINKESYSSVHLTNYGIKISNKLFTEYLLLYHYYMNEYNMSNEIARQEAITSVCEFSELGIEIITDYIIKNNVKKQNSVQY